MLTTLRRLFAIAHLLTAADQTSQALDHPLTLLPPHLTIQNQEYGLKADRHRERCYINTLANVTVFYMESDVIATLVSPTMVSNIVTCADILRMDLIVFVIVTHASTVTEVSKTVEHRHPRLLVTAVAEMTLMTLLLAHSAGSLYVLIASLQHAIHPANGWIMTSYASTVTLAVP